MKQAIRNPSIAVFTALAIAAVIGMTHGRSLAGEAGPFDDAAIEGARRVVREYCTSAVFEKQPGQAGLEVPSAPDGVLRALKLLLEKHDRSHLTDLAIYLVRFATADVEHSEGPLQLVNQPVMTDLARRIGLRFSGHHSSRLADWIGANTAEFPEPAVLEQELKRYREMRDRRGRQNAFLAEHPEMARWKQALKDTPPDEAALSEKEAILDSLLPEIEKPGKSLELKMKVFFRSTPSAPTQRFLKRLEDELAKAAPDSPRSFSLRSVLAFGYAVASPDVADRERAKGMHLALLTNSLWPKGTEAIREETVEDFLRFAALPQTRDIYGHECDTTLKLFRDYLDRANASSKTLLFGKALAWCGRYKKEALTLVEDGLRQDGNTKEWLVRALSFCLDVVATSPGASKEWVDRTVSMGDQALRQLIPMVNDKSEKTALLESASETMAKLERYDSALAYYRDAHQGEDSPAVLLHEAQLLVKNQQNDDAEKLIAGITGKPIDDATRLEVGKFFVLTRQHERAIAVLQACPLKWDSSLKDYRRSLSTSYNLAIALRDTKQLDNAIQVLQAVADHPRNDEGSNTFLQKVCKDMLANTTRARATGR